MALHLFFYGIVSTLLTYSSLSHTLHGGGQVSPTNSSTEQVNYVTPNRSMPCIADQHPCFTIDEYGSQVDKFFLNDSIFSFGPGNHSLTVGLDISGIHNVSFTGLPNNSVRIMVPNESVFIKFFNCGNIEIINIEFLVKSNFSHILFFESTFYVTLSNIAILGNGYIGCRSIISVKSTVKICNSTFVEIIGFSGAALFATSNSNIIFTGKNTFKSNVAMSGGAMFFYWCTVLFSGFNYFFIILQ